MWVSLSVFLILLGVGFKAEVFTGNKNNSTASAVPSTPPSPLLRVFSVQSSRSHCAGVLHLFQCQSSSQNCSATLPLCWQHLHESNGSKLCESLGCGALLELVPKKGRDTPSKPGTEGWGFKLGSVVKEKCDMVTEIQCAELKSRLPVRLSPLTPPLPCSGSVEVYSQSKWVPLCRNSRWTAQLANQICGEVGCGNDSANHNPPLAKSIQSWGVFCNKHNMSLFQCQHFLESEKCPPARVICKNSPHSLSLSLRGGASHCQGRVHVFHNDTWKPVCRGDQWSEDWTNACHALDCKKLKEEDEGGAEEKQEVMGVVCVNKSVSLSKCQHYLQDQIRCMSPSITCTGHPVPSTRALVSLQVITVLLSLVLLVLVMVKFGPRTYQNIRKRMSDRRERQWIGPTQSQSVSFYRAQSAQANADNKQRLSFPGLERMTVNSTRESSSARNSDYDSYN
ncbi:CD5 molecule [Amia ocellicauda]|uniref:CD5 molecule n=1 Tax=Amia ocellicauda TaxID=2972642 RepID=UPI0034644E2A|nr:DMBT1 protein [Amia calva]